MPQVMEEPFSSRADLLVSPERVTFLVPITAEVAVAQTLALSGVNSETVRVKSP